MLRRRTSPPRSRRRHVPRLLALAAVANALEPAPVLTKTQAPKPERPWIRTAATVEVAAPAANCYAAYSDLTRMPEWCPLLYSVEFDEATRESQWRMGYRRISVGWTARNLEERPPELLRWTSQFGVENFGAVAFEALNASRTSVECSITYQTPRVISDIVESKRSQNFISALLRA
eukprot:CAMPEP_0119285814 /NCGR_PEP_ID=MMETSP1329-20130426/32894_1 /TAXON_ID=114041 /ORGANISM="Genus nov. species nov., Strain RCC1024" /LENGTH=175 /DNA_ID=CAMNT_0007286535 /DNA_START=133 /DNA_END=657 /DNA_ORIENTATION=-